jgi:hypothetical protein
MSALERLAAERARLRVLAQSERERLARDLAPLAGALRIVDQAWAGVKWLQVQLLERPLVFGAALAVAIAVRPRRGLRLLRFALSVWQTWRWLGSALRAASKEGPSA